MRRAIQAVAAIFIASVVTFGFIGPVFAVDSASNAVVAGGEHVITIPIACWSLIVGTLLPLAVSLVTKLHAAAPVKIIINLVLSALSGLVGTAVVSSGAAVLSWSAVAIAGFTLLVSLVSYAHFWKPLNVPAKVAPSTGIG